MPCGYVYAAYFPCLGLTKVGRSENVEFRIRSLEVAHRAKASKTFSSDILADDCKIEKAVHSVLAEYRFEGEFFTADFESITEIIQNEQKADKIHLHKRFVISDDNNILNVGFNRELIESLELLGVSYHDFHEFNKKYNNERLRVIPIETLLLYVDALDIKGPEIPKTARKVLRRIMS